MRTILYYPNINIEDGVWLRNAILYWDKVSSIVPFRTYDEFSPEINYLRELDFYRPIYVNDILNRIEIQEFKEILSKKIMKYSIYNKQRDKKELLDFCVSEDVFSLLHYRKLPSEILDMFKKDNYYHGNDGDWVRIEKYITDIYMATLASIAPRAMYADNVELNDIVIGTDRPTKINDIYSNTYPRKDNLCFSVLLEKCLPQPSLDNSLEELIEFRNRRSGDLQNFRNELLGFENRIAKCCSPEEIRREMISFSECWKKELALTEKMFKSDRIKYFLGNFKALINAINVQDFISESVKNYTTRSIPTWLFGVSFAASSLLGVGISYKDYKNTLNIRSNNNAFSYLMYGQREGILRRTPFFEEIKLK